MKRAIGPTAAAQNGGAAAQESVARQVYAELYPLADIYLGR